MLLLFVLLFMSYEIKRRYSAVVDRVFVLMDTCCMASLNVKIVACSITVSSLGYSVVYIECFCFVNTSRPTEFVCSIACVT